MVTKRKSSVKTTTKTSSKPVSKTTRPTQKSTAKRRAARKTPVAKTNERDTLAKLRAHVDDIEKRLKRANNLTRNSVRALKTSYEALDGDKHTTVLTGHIEQLSQRLTGMIEQTRADVAHDLKIVLTDPRLETLSGALTKANQRLTAAEHDQAEAINAINAHIAKLATAVDERMQREQRQREKGEALLSERMDTIEKDSAAALKSIGDKVVNISEDLTEKIQNLQGEQAERALTRQQDYEEHKHDMARRIEAMEDEQRNQWPTFERNIASLSTRLEALESNLGGFEQDTVPVSAAPAYEPVPQISAEDQKTVYENQHADYGQPDDAFAALEQVESQEVVPPTEVQTGEVQLQEFATEQMGASMQVTNQTPQVYAPVEYVANAPAAAGGHTPEVFSPRTYVPGAQAEQIGDLPPSVTVVDNGSQVYSAPQATNEQVIYDQSPPPMPGAEAGAVTTPDIQTLEPTMENARPGVDPDAKPGKGKKRKAGKSGTGGPGSGGHGLIRKVALLGGVAVVALFAYKTFAPKIFGVDGNETLSTQNVPGKSIATVNVSEGPNGMTEEYQTANGQTFESVEPVGDYSDTMAAPDLDGEGTTTRTGQKQTLETAAAEGNPIAQFQLGLSHLEAGRDAEAIRLIRLAANQGQPAAQYRLAKLYEAGIGVKVNGKTAKDLLMRSAKAGNRIAMHDLGHYYATGADGSAPNLQEAVKWFSMAAERGVLDSQFNLAVLYQGGSGVPLSLDNAYVWYAIAGAQGDDIATQRSKAVARDLSKDALAKARSRVKAFAPKPVDNAANGVFKNLPWMSVKTKPDANATVKQAQTLLASLGYKVGRPDGAMGPNTRNAIISFERANGLPETGRVNAALIERLQLAAGA